MGGWWVGGGLLGREKVFFFEKKQICFGGFLVGVCFFFCGVGGG